MESAPLPAYYSNVRRDIVSLLPARATKILEVGCAAGATLAWLKQRWPQSTTTGIDGYEGARTSIARNADHVMIQDLNKPLNELGPFDLILALDILEHLSQPEQLLAQLRGFLSANGTIIVSVPNVAHLSVAVPLMMGRFEYTDEGILDRTHLRFFTAKSALKMMTDANLNVIKAAASGVEAGKNKLLDRLTLGVMRSRLARQIIMAGAIGGDQRTIRWGRAI